MEETKIWAVEGNSATQLDATNRMETEGLLEDILTKNPEMLEEGLELVGRQTSTAGGPLDLLGVDSDGVLVVFELKRGTLNREAVAQVIDYASDLNAMAPDILSRHIEQQSGKYGIEKIENFADWYSKLRESNDLPEGDLESLTPPKMVLVGLGVDDTTERMVNYMASGGMDISLLTFYGFINADGKTLLARNLEVDSERITANQGPRSRHRNRRARFEENVQNLPEDLRILLDKVERRLKSLHNGFVIGHSTIRMNFSLDFSWSAEHAWNDGTRAKRRVMFFIEIDESDGGINFGFHPIAVAFAHEEFSKLDGENIQFVIGQTQALWGTQEYRFPLQSLKDWEARKYKIEDLTQKVCKAYEAAREKALSKT